MIVGGQTEARAQLSSTIIDYHEPFDQGLRELKLLSIQINKESSFLFAPVFSKRNRKQFVPVSITL